LVRVPRTRDSETPSRMSRITPRTTAYSGLNRTPQASGRMA
jgi:hypothetical protein